MFSLFRLPVAVFGSVGLLVLAQAGTTCAQRPMRGPMAGRPAPVPVNTGGTIEAIGRGLIQIKSVGGQPYMLQLAERATVHVTGTAKKDVLGPGSFVSFFAEVDKRRSEVQEKIGELTIFTPSPQRPLGAFPGGRPAAGPDGFGANPLEATPDAGVQAPDAGQPPADARQTRSRGRRAHAEDEDEGPPVDNFEIVGRITGIDKTGKLTVYAPNPYFKSAVQIELTEDPHIELDLADARMLTIARPGDKVLVRGQQVAPNAIQVNEIAVELAEPFTTVQPEEPGKKPPRRTTRSRRGRAEPEEAAEGEKTEKAVEEKVEEKAEEKPKEKAKEKAEEKKE
ncbi:MAG TPA: hypothetical protein VMY37_14990 [Thermoguttaceae bacterium]|nr:hypothetical protein [Thermoguttaceae bacterium]